MSNAAMCGTSCNWEIQIKLLWRIGRFQWIRIKLLCGGSGGFNASGSKVTVQDHVTSGHALPWMVPVAEWCDGGGVLASAYPNMVWYCSPTPSTEHRASTQQKAQRQKCTIVSELVSKRIS